MQNLCALMSWWRSAFNEVVNDWVPPELPMKFSGHCSAKINQTHVLLTGTADYFNGDQTLIVDVSSTDNSTSMIFGSKMNQKRHYHACGTFIHEGKIQVVVAGNHPDSSDLRSTEIWDITFDNGWIQGKNSYTGSPRIRLPHIGLISL